MDFFTLWQDAIRDTRIAMWIAQQGGIEKARVAWLCSFSGKIESIPSIGG